MHNLSKNSSTRPAAIDNGRPAAPQSRAAFPLGGGYPERRAIFFQELFVSHSLVVGFLCLSLVMALGALQARSAELVSLAKPPQRLIAHRGASHDAPENTLAAFRLAWEQGADGIEGDFRLTKDGQIVCLHDADTKRTAGENLVAAQSTLAELRKLDVGAKKHARYQGEKIPTFAEVAACVPEGKLFFIELKIGPEIVAPLAAELAKTKLLSEQIVIISFSADALSECKKLLPKLRTHWLTSYKRPEGDKDWSRGTPTAQTVAQTLSRIHADGLGTQGNADIVTADFLAVLKSAGLTQFHVWTIDDPAAAARFLQLGAWSITTNRPAFLREALNKQR